MTRTAVRAYAVVAISVLYCCSVTDANNTGPDSHAASDTTVTVALIADKAFDLHKSPLVSLLEARLSEEPNLVLLERDQIDKILQEQQLQLMFSAGGVGERIAIGRLLKADLLILLRGREENQIRQLDIIVAETESGLRLLVRTVLWSDDPLSDTSTIAGLISQGLEKHRSEITHICAVPPFISNNLSHRHDYLQAAYARIAELEVLRWSNWVVVELEEAEAVAKELAASGENNKVQRSLPHYILGEFRHEAIEADSQVSITMRLKRDAEVSSKFSAERLSSADAVDFVRNTIQQMMSQIQKDLILNVTHPNVAEEVRTLVTTARVFQTSGEFEKATALCEAALLLDPDNNDIRKNILGFCNNILRVRLPGGRPESYYLNEWKQRLRYVLRSGEHLSILVRTKQFDSFHELGECVETPWKRFRAAQRSQMCWQVKSGLDAELAELTQACRDFVLNDLPRTWRAEGWPDLKVSKRRGIGSNWSSLIPYYDYRDYGRHARVPTRDDFRYRLRLAHEVLADKPGSGSYLRYLAAYGHGWALRLKDIGEDAFEQFDRDYSWFLDQLTASEKPILKLVGQHGRMKWECESRPREITPEVLDEIEKAAQECPDMYVKESYTETSKKIRRLYHLYHFSGPRQRSKHRRPVEQPVLDPVVRYEPVKIRFVKHEGGDLDDRSRWQEISGRMTIVTGVIRCMKGIDALWNQRAIYAMDRRGEAIQIFADPNTTITDMCWDGRWLWAATRQGRLLLVEPKKRNIRSIGSAEGLPESGMGMVVCPLEHGRICAIGSFPPHGRAWCAVVTSEGKVNVFHEARSLPKNWEDTTAAAVFAPAWAIPIPAPSDPKVVDRVVVGRKESVRWYSAQKMVRRPLVIDALRLTVEPAEFVLPEGQPAGDVRPGGIMLSDSTIVISGSNDSSVWALDISDGTSIRLTDSASKMGEGELVEWAGKIYVPGGVEWFEIDAETLSTRFISPRLLLDKQTA